MLGTVKLSLTVVLALGILAGCATQTSTKTVKTETVQYAGEPDESGTEPVVTNSNTTETTTDEGSSVGLLSGAVHGVGQVLALPFRAVGGLIGLVF